jgi:PilZ domain
MTDQTKHGDSVHGRDHRSARLFAADLIIVGAPDQRVVIKDISSSGCSARADHIPGVGSAVSISIHGAGLIPGTIAWIAKGRFGIRFNEKIDANAAIRGERPNRDFEVKDMHKPPNDTKRPGLGTKS